jgi:5,10-methylenetetrahydrofolate reductase
MFGGRIVAGCYIALARERCRMTISETSSKAQSKNAAARGRRAVKPKAVTVTTADGAGGQAQAVRCMLTKIEKKMKGDQMKATLGDYIRLVQLHKELDDESPKEIRVTWVEPAERSAKEE